ncbi:flagellar basal-body MS-ring/collar protein FliF [Solimonas sp. SE-A11]|uniref:flagellar basal-body MS-ring/collar protein FliF n=1 Tax=Solimonas sp. SE-A11 TaxID=3054954 RepID=UPI00259CE81F|nr:flagellar basal-body MS-ring/collar protein FliF [Solimonas sp. SE-A11]MDM4772912.1 flagellar basal-body MS-ring/collar protein FliF [Solimonas sp. SE-A11]
MDKVSDNKSWANWWSGRSGRDQLVIASAVGVILVFFAAAVAWALMPQYRLLLSNLSAEDAANIANQLALEKIRYRLDEKNGRLMVDEADLDLARMYVMERGLPQNQPVGFELFDESDFGMTDFNQRINYQRALEGELTRTIMALDEVDHARLHLVIPEVSLFKRQDEVPKASLTLSLKPGATLSQRSVQGIQNLIASAVPGLVSERVAIHDNFGSPLSTATADPLSGGIVAARLEAKRSYEAYLSRKAQDVLDRSFGVGAAAVMVDVEVDHDRKQLTRSEVLPVREGVTGAVTGLRSLRGSPGADGEGEEISDLAPRNATAEVKYEVGRQEEKIDVTAGAIRRMTVGVLVPVGTLPEERQRIADTIANAIGLDTRSRGDSITVQELGAAARTLRMAEKLEPMPAATSTVIDWKKTALLVATVLAVLALLLAVYSWMRSGGQLSQTEREQLLKDVRGLLERMDAPAGRAVP